ncbi:MAG TPA: NADH-quinone oxidoreductase subunit NuoN [Aestuariivirgaceae bacterium]|nr:NADH-quinone oxidoreductase subunit NuoN [Aestuariivirgaceae bacterium]
MNETHISSYILVALPEIWLALATMALLMFGAFRRGETADLVNSASILVLAVAAGFVMFGSEGRALAFDGAFVADGFARLMKILVLLGSATAVILSVQFMKAERIERFEYPVLILLATLGMLMMISANDMIGLYLGLELQALALYVVAAIDRDSTRSSEAGLKYFVLGALSSGMLLYGMSLIYGFTGSTNFADIATQVSAAGSSVGLIFGLVFLLAGLAFKISAVPFHMWTPDVYEGAPTPVTAFFAAAPKIAGMAVFVRAVIAPFSAIAADWQQIVVFIAIASMVLGAFAAIGQSNIKRLLAYSSIGHVGYALVGLAAGTPEGVRGVIVYLIIYLVMTLGTFGCVLTMRRRDGAVEEIADLAGLARTNRPMAFVLAVLMFSLAGIPPLAGFFAKYFVFLAAIQAGLVTLAVIGVVASVIGAYYYVRIVKLMYFDEAVEPFEPMPREIKLVVAVAGVFVLGFVIVAEPIVGLAHAAALSLF